MVPENIHRLNLHIDKELLHRAKIRAAEESEGANSSVTKLVVRAVEQYLDGKPEDARLAAIESAYSALDDAGRDWLMTCASYAVNNAKWQRREAWMRKSAGEKAGSRPD